MEYDAVLTEYTISSFAGYQMVVGTINGDKKLRFADGDRVRTSYIKELMRTEEGLFAITRNSVYKLEEPVEVE